MRSMILASDASGQDKLSKKVKGKRQKVKSKRKTASLLMFQTFAFYLFTFTFLLPASAADFEAVASLQHGVGNFTRFNLFQVVLGRNQTTIRALS